ncbi:MAG: energy transducer TonB [Rikenellaceae bacterium]
MKFFRDIFVIALLSTLCPSLWAQNFPSPFNDSRIVVDKIPTINSDNLGEQPFYSMVLKKLYYPDNLIRSEISGDVDVQYIIEKNGKISHIEILKSPDRQLSNLVIGALKQAPKISPAIKDGKAVAFKAAHLVKFRTHTSNDLELVSVQDVNINPQNYNSQIRTKLSDKNKEREFIRKGGENVNTSDMQFIRGGTTATISISTPSWCKGEEAPYKIKGDKKSVTSLPRMSDGRPYETIAKLLNTPPILSTWIFLWISDDFRVKISATHPLKEAISPYFSVVDMMTRGARYKLCAIASSKCCEWVFVNPT